MIRMLRLYDRYSVSLKRTSWKPAGKNHFIDYSVHASILKPDQVQDISYLRDAGSRLAQRST